MGCWGRCPAHRRLPGRAEARPRRTQNRRILPAPVNCSPLPPHLPRLEPSPGCEAFEKLPPISEDEIRRPGPPLPSKKFQFQKRHSMPYPVNDPASGLPACPKKWIGFEANASLAEPERRDAGSAAADLDAETRERRSPGCRTLPRVSSWSEGLNGSSTGLPGDRPSGTPSQRSCESSRASW